MMKKTIAVILAILLITVMFSGCNTTETTSTSSSDASSADSSSDADVSATAEEAGGNEVEIDTSKETIKIGASRSMTGVYAMFDETSFGPCYRMWVDQVNEDGGIYVEEYGKKMPIELIIYDDTSDMGTMTQLLQKLILEDEVDFLFPPVSTAFLNAAIPIAAEYGYLMFCGEGGSASLSESISEYPNFFSTINHSETQIPAMADVFVDVGVESAYIVYIQDTHGIEYSEAAESAFTEAGIEIVEMKSVSADIKDTLPIVNDAKESGADAFVLFCYPDQNIPIISNAIEVGYNPKALMVGPIGSYNTMTALFGGAEMVEGVMFEGAYNDKNSPEIAEYIAELSAYAADNPDENPGFVVDWWAHYLYGVTLQVFQQAIEQTGTLDNSVITEYIKDNHFDTILGDTYFIDQQLAPECFKGQIGQWQDGYPEVIDVGENRTADPICPKPDWPTE